MARARSGKARRRTQKRGRGARSGPASSDWAVTPGVGPNIPRATLGHDTLLGVAQSQRRTLTYVATVTQGTAAAGAYAEYVFQLNSAFRPDPAVAVPAVGYTKYMGLYSKSWVLGSRIRIRGVTSTVSAANLVTGLCVSTNATAFASAVAAIGNGMSDWMMVGANPDRVALSQAVEVAKFMNKPRILDDPQFFATNAASPSQLVVAHFFVQTFGGVSVSVDLVVEIDFDVVFTDPIPFT